MSAEGVHVEATGSFAPQTALRIREAARDQVPLDQMLLQLRQIIVGPTERVSAARLDEMVDMLAEQRSLSDQRIDAMASTAEAMAQRTARLEGGLVNLDRAVSDRISEESKLLRESLADVLVKTCNELETRVTQVSQTLHSALQELRAKVGDDMQDLQNSLSAHIQQDAQERKRDREYSMTAVEQRIAKWRAEIEDMRRGDMQEVATSMMDIGQRLMALR
jgi:hypothetical protein